MGEQQTHRPSLPPLPPGIRRTLSIVVPVAVTAIAILGLVAAGGLEGPAIVATKLGQAWVCGLGLGVALDIGGLIFADEPQDASAFLRAVTLGAVGLGMGAGLVAGGLAIMGQPAWAEGIGCVATLAVGGTITAGLGWAAFHLLGRRLDRDLS